jgi:hypothetical protein
MNFLSCLVAAWVQRAFIIDAFNHFAPDYARRTQTEQLDLGQGD